LHRQGNEELAREGFSRSQLSIEDFVDLRYRGQSYELTIPLAANLVARFHRTHEQRYGYSNPDKAVEVVNVRTTVTGRVPKPRFNRTRKVRGRPKPLEIRSIWIDRKRQNAAIYDRDALAYGHVFEGPAIVGEYSSTTLVPADFTCRVDPWLNLVLER
jgi:N-methylhydantoinase A